jgi:hypothetical protein
LKLILGSTFADRKFVKQLQPNCEILTEFDRQFLTPSKNLILVSFYESTGIGTVEVRCTRERANVQAIVPKTSAVLGHPDEDSSPLNGNHIEIVKYASPRDPNYRTMSWKLSQIVKRVRSETQLQFSDS